MKHTSGPWRLKRSTTFNEQRELVEYYWVGHGPIGDEEPVLSRFSHANEANARLISAAPELLDALDKTYSQIIELLNEGQFDQMIEFDAGYIVDALKKARGE